jgi:hypothetical protein
VASVTDEADVATGVKSRPLAADDIGVKLQRCPYDGTPIAAESYSGGSLLLECESCGAAWEAHNSLVRRIAEPDWDRARAARATYAKSMRLESEPIQS